MSEKRATRKMLVDALRDAEAICDMIDRNAEVISGALRAKGLPDFPGVGYAPKRARILAALLAAEP